MFCILFTEVANKQQERRGLMMTAEKINQPYHRLKYIMSKQGINQSDIADLLEKDISTVNQKINRSSGRDFTLSEAQKIANFLGVSISNFFN